MVTTGEDLHGQQGRPHGLAVGGDALFYRDDRVPILIAATLHGLGGFLFLWFVAALRSTLEAERRESSTARQAILEAATVRFRPIMMTTMAALVGTLPIALGHGAGAESRRPLGIAVVGGLIFSQLITLYITPVVYTYLDAWQQRLAHRKVTQPSD